MDANGSFRADAYALQLKGSWDLVSKGSLKGSFKGFFRV